MEECVSRSHFRTLILTFVTFFFLLTVSSSRLINIIPCLSHFPLHPYQISAWVVIESHSSRGSWLSFPANLNDITCLVSRFYSFTHSFPISLDFRKREVRVQQCNCLSIYYVLGLSPPLLLPDHLPPSLITVQMFT